MGGWEWLDQIHLDLGEILGLPSIQTYLIIGYLADRSP